MEPSSPVPNATPSPFETASPTQNRLSTHNPLPPVIDPRNKPTLNVPQNKYTTYDFSPFLSSPAVLHRMRENRQQIPLLSPHPLNTDPVPLAENLHPSVIKDVRDFLLGTGKYNSPYQRNYFGNGKEVWASWKRAWDIWNNHYIEGRVNEVWVARAYKQWEAYIAQQSKKGKAPFEGPAGRNPVRRKKVEIGKPYRTESKALEQFEVSIDEVAQGRKEFKQRSIEHLKGLFKRNRNLGHGYIEFCEALAEWTRREWNRPEWSQYKDYKNKAPEYLPLTMDYVHEELYGETKERVIELLGTEFWRKDPKLEAHPGTIEYAIAVAEWEQQAEVRRCRFTERPNWIHTYEPAEKLEDKYIESAKKRTSPAVIDEFRKRMDVNRKLGVGYIELSWQEAHYNINLKAHEGDIDPTIQELEKPDPKDYIDKARPGKPDESAAPVTAIDRDRGDEEEDQDDDDIDPNDLPRPLPIEDDGSSGGFFAMRDFIEYAVPDEDDASFQEYYDPIENSIWRPIQVCEQRPKIDMDEEPDSFLKNSQFEIDGGVDCGRSPYPLLRPLYRYAQSYVGAPKDSNPEKQPSFKKQGSLLKLKKFWDKVTGTIFNIPTKNIYTQTLDKIEDRNHRESFNNNESYQNPDIFPLDIRRCEKITTPFKPGKVPPKSVDFRDTDTIIQPSFRMKEKEYRPMRFDDPWWVEAEQKYYRDMPPRNYPPKFDETQSHLPKDVKLWKEEVEKDSDLKKRYFVANLDGRLLTINGIEVGKGEIAGPLPEFAIIQTEGGGVSFWHGVGGRFYLQPAGARMKDWSRQWSQLRQTLNDEYFGVASGYFWQNAIVGKIMEDDEGEGEQDPKWIKWKSAKPARNTNGVDPRAVKLHPGFLDSHSQSSENEDWGAPGPLPFESPEAELKWAAAQLHFREMFINQPWLKAKMVEPTKNTAWGGLQEDYRDPSDGPTDEARDEWWASNGDHTQKIQVKSGQTFEERLREEFDADRATVEAISLKRQADNDGYFLPNAKRFRENIEDREKQKIEDIEQKEVEQLNMGIKELVDQINQGAKDIAEKAEPGALVKQIDQWHPASGADAEAQAKEALQRVRELERLRLLFNERRKNANESAIPPFKDPIAGLAPSNILTLPENQWALEAIVRHREEYRLDQEVQETGALNNLNASERLKRKRIAEKRNRGTLGFSIMTDAPLKEQEKQLVIKAKEQREEEDFRKILKLTNAYKLKAKQVKKDEKHVAAVKDGTQAGDIVKAEAAMKKGQKELKDTELEIAKQLSISSLAKAEGISIEDLIEYSNTPGFDPTDPGTWVSKVARTKREEEILKGAEEAAMSMKIPIDEWYKTIHGVTNSNEYLKKMAKSELPKYEFTDNAQKAKKEFGAKLLRSVSGHDGTRKGQFTSWDDVISSIPVAIDWDTVLNSSQETDPQIFGLTPRSQAISTYDGQSLWVGQL